MDDDKILQKVKSVCLSYLDNKLMNDECDNTAYRRIDGQCNNVHNIEWGASYAPFQRILAPDYADGMFLLLNY